MKTFLLGIVLMILIPQLMISQTTQEKIESIVSLIESESSYKGVEVQLILREILKIAVEEIQLTANETAEKVKLELVPIINAKETENNIIWISCGIIGMGTFIYGLLKNDTVLEVAGGALAGAALIRFSIKIGFGK